MRLILFGLILYFAWRALKNLILPPMEGRGPVDHGPEQIDDVMVKDPQCQVYIPMRQAISARVGGETLYFCSESCRDQYRENH
ncbi:MAG: hypothetical protein KKA60_04135 [Proteobacteria bacterium]|nr:hypothetical protein [Pseudomonadota bacterium]